MIKIVNRKSISGSSSFGRALAFQAGGGGFEPRLPLDSAAEGENKKLKRKDSKRAVINQAVVAQW